MAASPENWGKLKETRLRLEKCWGVDLDWSLFPESLKQGCEQVGKALNLPATAVLCGYIVLGSFMLSPSVIRVPDTDWSEPVLVWLTVCMPTGSGKSTLFRHLFAIIQAVRDQCSLTKDAPTWLVDDATLEKMGALMSENKGRLLGLYDELSAFLTQINVYSGRGLSSSHELALFLQLFNGHPWRRDTVTGDANFNMESTSLTVGGFTQPGVARTLIEIPANTEKGLSQRFVWMFPNPLYEKFSSLGEVHLEFMLKMRTLLQRQWREGKRGETINSRVFSISHNSTVFGDYYDKVQELLKAMAGMDELLQGMLSKSRGHVLRLATVIHLLFHIDDPEEPLDTIVSDAALRAAVNFIEVSCQQTAFIAGRDTMSDELDKFKAVDITAPVSSDKESSAAGYCLSLPGKRLYLTPLLAQKKFRKKGNKEGALRAFCKLEEDGLGRLLEVAGSKGNVCQYEFEKLQIPETQEGKIELSKKLAVYGLSLTQYAHALNKREIKSVCGMKRFTEQDARKVLHFSPKSPREKTSPRKKKNSPYKQTTPCKTTP